MKDRDRSDIVRRLDWARWALVFAVVAMALAALGVVVRLGVGSTITQAGSQQNSALHWYTIDVREQACDVIVYSETYKDSSMVLVGCH